MDAASDLQIIGVSKEIAAVPDVRRVVGAGSGDGAPAGCGDSATNCDTAGVGTGNERKARGNRKPK